MIAVALWAFLFGCAAFVGLVASQLLSANIVALDDGPKPVHVHEAVFIVLFAAVGYVLAIRGATVLQLGLVALIGVPLIGACYSDLRKGIVPDAFTLIPIAIIAVAVVINHYWWVAASMLLIFIAFAIASWFSKGLGIGWGDTKLATLCAAVLGLQDALLALAIACLVATGVSVIRSRGKQPVALAPFIVLAALTTIVLTVHA